MIREYSKLVVADNTGAKVAQCFRVLGGTRKRYARIGDIIVVTVKDALPGGTVKDNPGDQKKGRLLYPFF
jgi:large subunit ribosomal protein L14